MIELIFVIVIIGILAAIAIPKLVATRDDAKVSVLAKAIQTVQSEIATYIFSTSIVPQTTADMIKVSNTVRELKDFVVVNNKVINIVDTDNSQVCKVLTINDSDASKIKLVLTDGAGVSAICQGLQKLIPDNNTGITIAGNIVKY
jgi:general secretion pathway protein G